MENNVITLVGTVETFPVYSHTVLEENFYNFLLRVPRLSNNDDMLPITVPERQLDSQLLKIGNRVKIKGQLRSYNKYTQDKTRLILTVFARGICHAELTDDENPNEIFINGYICKAPVYRRTPFGREITDLIVAVNRAYGKSDYIPCIAWGRNAKYASKFDVGDNVEIWGRIQSRQYIKRLDDGDEIIKTAYEISVSRMNIIKKVREDEISQL